MTIASLTAYRALRQMGFKPARAWKLAHNRAIAMVIGGLVAHRPENG